MSWQIVPLDKSHQRKDFDCGEPSLNEFLQRYARQNEGTGISRTYVLLEEGSSTIVGYYSLCTGSISFATLPDEHSRKIPKYPVPTAHIGRLAVDRTRQGQGLGPMLLERIKPVTQPHVPLVVILDGATLASVAAIQVITALGIPLEVGSQRPIA